MAAFEVSKELGGGEKVEQLHNNAKEAKKIALKSLRNSLSEVLPWSLEEHLLDNILGHLNLLEEEANQPWRLETAEEEKPGLSSLYLHLSQIYSQIRTNLFTNSWFNPELNHELIDPLQEILAELKTEETTEETEQEDEGGEIMGGNEVEVEVEDGGNDEVKEEDKGENQLEKRLETVEEEKSSLSSQLSEVEETTEEIKPEAEAVEITGVKEVEKIWSFESKFFVPFFLILVSIMENKGVKSSSEY